MSKNPPEITGGTDINFTGSYPIRVTESEDVIDKMIDDATLLDRLIERTTVGIDGVYQTRETFRGPDTPLPDSVELNGGVKIDLTGDKKINLQSGPVGPMHGDNWRSLGLEPLKK